MSYSMVASTPVSAAAAWREVAAWPDFQGGLWVAKQADGRPLPSELSLKPEVQANVKAEMQKFAAALDGGTCVPRGMPRHLGNQFIYSKGLIVMLGTPDYYMVVRRIYMDGRQHDNPEPTYFGHSIGRWDRGTLVIDTEGFLPDAPITDGVPGYGRTHVVERYRLLKPGQLQLQLTLENPEVLTQPWSVTRVYELQANEDAPEAYCTNNRDFAGRTDLTPPR